MRLRLAAPLAVMAIASSFSWRANAGPVVAPGEEAAKHAEPAPPSPSPAASAPAVGTSVEIHGEKRPARKEDERVGDYQQPRWASHRRFPTTRVYVMPKGEVEAEYWMRYTAPLRDPGGSREIRSYYELGFGLGHRLQFDAYLVTQQTGFGGPIELNREQLEVRYALADWGELWGNPTLYLEWQHRANENDRLEGKILLGGEIAPRWHGGFNLVLEREISGRQENEWNVTGGVSYTAVDEIFHAGIEAYAEVHDTMGSRFHWGDTEQLFLGGPSFMLSPIPRAHFLLAPLFGAGQDGAGERFEGKFRLWFVAAWAF